MSVNEYARVGSNRPCRIPTRVRLVKSPPWLQAVAVQECPAQAAEVVATVIGGPEDSMRPSWSWSVQLPAASIAKASPMAARNATTSARSESSSDCISGNCNANSSNSPSRPARRSAVARHQPAAMCSYLIRTAVTFTTPPRNGSNHVRSSTAPANRLEHRHPPG